MEKRTKITAAPGKQDLTITREFDLPLELLFKAYAEPELLEQWMGTKVLKLENQKHGGWEFETKDGNGNVVFRAHGVIHEFIGNKKITRTFEMQDGSFGIQLEFLEFEELPGDTSKLTIHTLYKSNENRDQMLQLGMSQGANMAHNRLQDVLSKLK